MSQSKNTITNCVSSEPVIVQNNQIFTSSTLGDVLTNVKTDSKNYTIQCTNKPGLKPQIIYDSTQQPTFNNLSLSNKQCFFQSNDHSSSNATLYGVYIKSIDRKNIIQNNQIQGHDLKDTFFLCKQ